MRIVALFVCLVSTCTLAAQQSTTTYKSSIAGSTTTVTPPKYYVGQIDLSGSDGVKPKSSGCLTSKPDSKIESPELKDGQSYLLGEIPVAIHITTTDGCPVKLTWTGDAINIISSDGRDESASATPSSAAYLVLFVKKGNATVNAVEEPSEAESKYVPHRTWNIEVYEDSSLCIEGLLPQKAVKKDKPALSSSVVPYLGNPAPYSFQGAGDKVLVYSTRELSDDMNRKAVGRFTKEAQTIMAAIGNANDEPDATAGTPSNAGALAPVSSAPGASVSKPAYSIEVSVPHSGSLGDLATRLNTANYSNFTIQDVGSSKVRITSKTMPKCVELTAFLRNLRDLAWKPLPTNPVDKLFFLNASDITGALGGGSILSSSSPGSSTSQSGTPPTGSNTSSGGSGTPSSGTNSAAGSAGGALSPNTAGGTLSLTDASPQAGTSSTSSFSPASISGSSGSSSGPGSAPGSKSDTTNQGAASTSSPPAPTVSGVGPDTLLFQDPVPGDDAAISERRRLVAMLDLPRPQMIINVWSLQTSSTKGERVANSVDKIHLKVGEYNDRIQESFQAGWQYLRDQISKNPSFFDAKFYEYLTGKYVQDPPLQVSAAGVSTDLKPQETAQRILMRQTGTAMPDDLRKAHGICPAKKYCLGYASIFRPLKPRLTDLLIATIASGDPVDTVNEALKRMESQDPVPDDNCVERDVKSEHNDPKHFYMECFRDASKTQFDSNGQPSSLGLLRAALANFLFQYKLSQMYPHEFEDYDLSQSAQNLNAQLAPIVEAFNRDLEAFQSVFSEHVMNSKESDESENWFGSERPSFVNNGVVTVRTVSGYDTTVSTTSQNFLDATQMPTASSLVQSIVGAGPGSASNPSNAQSVLKNISPVQAQVILGALAAYQPSKVQIGRTLNIDITPRSLNEASSAELTVKINADESASPTYYNPTGSSSSADISRVANHDTSTRVRVDSIKLFDVSTFTAVLQKSRTRFPLLPPFVEIPYIGTVVGVPLPVAKEFHSSMAVLSTMIVPTASDIVLGLSFGADRLVDSDGATSCSWPSHGEAKSTSSCTLRRATTFSDLKATAIRHYNSGILSCFAVGDSCDVSLSDPFITD